MSETLDLFKAALGLGEPWRVTRSDFDVAQGRLDLYLDFPRGARFGCAVAGCDQGSCPVHDTEAKTWRHMDFFQHKVYLHARVPRTRCPEHGVHLVGVAWARPESGFTRQGDSFSGGGFLQFGADPQAPMLQGGVNGVLTEALESVLHDLRVSGAPTPRVEPMAYRVWRADPDPDYASAMLWSGDGTSGVGVQVRLSDPEPDRIAQVADQVQEWAFYELQATAATNWPPCPRHPGRHPLTASVICLLYTSPSPRDGLLSRMPSSA